MNDFLARFATAIDAMPQVPAVVVGLSGGIDSVVLLAAMHDYQRQHPQLGLRAVHVNHGLHAQAGQWQQFCETLCREMAVPLTTRQVTVTAGGSLEAAAREARYRAFADVLASGEALLLAQHLDDQLETLLLRLMRGAGCGGLAGMPRRRDLGKGFLYRPLLEFTRRDIHDFAAGQQLQWIEDPSNTDTGLDRNYCRHELLPRIAERWPNYRESWQKSQALLGEADGLLQEMAAEDLKRSGNHDGSALSVAAVGQLHPPRRRNLLRHWLDTLTVADPGWHRLHQISDELLSGAADNQGALPLGDITLQIFDGYLHALQLPALPEADGRHWNALAQSLLTLPGNGQLQARQRQGRGLGRVHADALEIRYRQGGESIRLPSRPTKSLKKLLQEEPVAPWLRERLPLLYQRGRLVCIPGIGPLKDCAAKPDEEGLIIDWHPPDFTLRPV